MPHGCLPRDIRSARRRVRSIELPRRTLARGRGFDTAALVLGIDMIHSRGRGGKCVDSVLVRRCNGSKGWSGVKYFNPQPPPPLPRVRTLLDMPRTLVGSSFFIYPVR